MKKKTQIQDVNLLFDKTLIPLLSKPLEYKDYVILASCFGLFLLIQSCTRNIKIIMVLVCLLMRVLWIVWFQQVRQTTKSGTVDLRLAGLLDRISEYSNIPRKKAKFQVGNIVMSIPPVYRKHTNEMIYTSSVVLDCVGLLLCECIAILANINLWQNTIIITVIFIIIIIIISLLYEGLNRKPGWNCLAYFFKRIHQIVAFMLTICYAKLVLSFIHFTHL